MWLCETERDRREREEEWWIEDREREGVRKRERDGVLMVQLDFDVIFSPYWK